MPCTAELFDACHLLFGPEVEASIDFLRYLRPSGLKSAYRQKALETHPDRARAFGEDEIKFTEYFKKVNQAYQKLNSVVREDGLIEIKDESNSHYKYTRRTHPGTKPSESGRSKRFSDHFYTGRIPERTLYIGQFLYYSGVISWQTMIEAISYQRRCRPMIGQIAVEWEMLKESDIFNILKARHVREKFGECAVRAKIISQFHLMALLGKQRQFQCPLGNYFIQNGILHSREINSLVEKQKIHNTKARRKWR